MHVIEHSLTVEAPLSKVYNQWTQFETFPEFMEGIESVEQLDDKRLHWVASIAGKRKEWDAEIFEQTPDQIIAWRSTSGAKNSGQVRFDPEGPNETRIYLRLALDPEGPTENLADAIGLVSARVLGDLKRFKKFIEGKSAETGAWRGEIHKREVYPPGEESRPSPKEQGF